MPIGVLLAQVGTPDAPTPRSVRRYLGRFLSDRRVVDYPAWLWQPLLRGVILPLRSRRSARLYRRIWTDQGSPLLVESQKQQMRVQAALGGDYRVVLGMAYAGPSFSAAIDDLISAGIDRVIVLPMFPQYSSATTASVYDAVFDAAANRHRRARVLVPALSFVAPYYVDPGYISAVARRVSDAAARANPDHYVITFHGLPERYVTNGDPYRAHCAATTAALVNAMGWRDADFSVSFQSRFGPEKWLEPSTSDVLKSLYGRGVRRPLVIAPGFTTDCLETLDELGNEGREEFADGGGDPSLYALCPCLNDLDGWIETMATLVRGARTKP